MLVDKLGLSQAIFKYDFQELLRSHESVVAALTPHFNFRERRLKAD